MLFLLCGFVIVECIGEILCCFVVGSVSANSSLKIVIVFKYRVLSAL